MTTCSRADGGAGSNYPFLTSKERDIETGLDYFLARYYSSTQGRFTSPDEFTGGPDELYNFAEDASNNPTFYADLTNPQSLNKYQYTYNNPLNMVDPDGHCPEGAAGVACRLAPVVVAIPGGLEVAAGAGAVVILAHAFKALPGDDTAGGGDCMACDRGIRQAQQLMAKQDKTQQVRDNVQGGAKGSAKGQQSQEGQSTNYQPNPKHDGPKRDDRRGVSPQPKAGGSLYDSATQVKPGQRVGVDRSSGSFVVYRTDPNGQTHGYETTWKGLRNDQRAALQKAGVVTKHGRIKEPE